MFACRALHVDYLLLESGATNLASWGRQIMWAELNNCLAFAYLMVVLGAGNLVDFYVDSCGAVSLAQLTIKLQCCFDILVFHFQRRAVKTRTYYTLEVLSMLLIRLAVHLDTVDLKTQLTACAKLFPTVCLSRETRLKIVAGCLS